VASDVDEHLLGRACLTVGRLGHGDCGGFTFDSRDPDGWIFCACGDALLLIECSCDECRAGRS
jgi:hypothetical protein